MPCHPFRIAFALLASAGPLSAWGADTLMDAGWAGSGTAVATGYQTGNSALDSSLADLHRTSGGKIVMISRQSDHDGVLMWRLHPDGTTDASFGGGDGVTEPEWDGGSFYPTSSLRRADGQIALAGRANGGSGVCLLPVAGTNFNGSFGDNDGCATHSFVVLQEVGDRESYSDLVNLPGNALMAVGFWSDDQILITTSGLGISGMDANGDPLIGFGVNGHVSLQWEGLHALTPRATRVRGGQVVIVFGGLRYTPSASQDLYAIRVNMADGSVDANYGVDGLARIHFDGVGGGDAEVSVRDAEVLTDGSVVAALQLRGAGNLEWVGAAKLDPDGNADSDFGNVGGRAWFRFDELFQYERVGGMTVDNQGRMLITVTISDTKYWDNGTELAMARLGPDGKFDKTFGDFGRWRMELDRAGVGSKDLAASTLYENGRLLLGALSDGEIGDLVAELEPTIIGFKSSLFRDGLEDPLLQPEP
ncbi:MAG: hypothetical protein KDI75_05900 [Xanthomonadales bacterium]|nr:hypothetical protein [Xanthomonadales bacterium]